MANEEVREYTIADMLQYSWEQKPLEFETAFRAVVSARLQDAVENRKVEVAQSMYDESEADPEYLAQKPKLDAIRKKQAAEWKKRNPSMAKFGKNPPAYSEKRAEE